MAENEKSSSNRQQEAVPTRIIREGYQPTELAGGGPTAEPPSNPPNQGSGGEPDEGDEGGS